MFAASKTDGVVAGGPPPSGDPYWSNVSLLTNFENNLTFRDESTNNFAITRNGTVNPSLNSPFSGVGGSEKFTGSSSYLTSPANAAFALGSGDFTVEAWCYFNSITNTYSQLVMGTHYYSPGTSDRGWALGLSSTGYPLVYLFGSSGGIELFTSPNIATTNTWMHIAAARQGTTLRLFVNGVIVVSGSSTKNEDWTSSVFKVATDEATTLSPSIGNSLTSVNGFISNLRIVKGTAVYTANFTPPTAPLTAITNTSLLITGTGQGMFNNATFVDQGPNALTVTATGAPVYSGRSPFGNTYPGSVYVPTSSYLQTTASAAYTFTANFTIECFVLIPSGVSQSTYSQIVLSGSANQGIHSSFAGATNTFYMFNIGGNVASGVTSNDGLWHHLAVVRNGSTVTFYVDGISKGTTTTSATIDFGSTTGPKIGSGGAGDNTYQGYISNVRITKGTAVYTANFTPSTTPLTAITNTSLLVRGDTGAFYDLSNNGNSMTSTGTTAVTTQVKKYGAESASYTATAYQTVVDAVNLQLGTGDYTIEAWVYRNAAGVLHSLICKGAAATGWLLQVNSSNQLVFTVTSTAILTSTTTIAATTWTFVTVTRSGTSTRLFVGGNLEATATDSTNFNQTNALLVGADRSNANGLNGYLDDIRITKGVARYTANFTPPTATFPTGS